MAIGKERSKSGESGSFRLMLGRALNKMVLETLVYLSTVDLTPVLPHISTPALVMVGGRSSMNTPGRARSMAALLPNATLVEVPGASGYVQHSAPATCVSLWRDFAQALGD